MGINNIIPIREVKVIGHRGHPSLYPENTIQGFESLLELGTDALELDLVISADKKVVVSHEAYMSAEYMYKPDGFQITTSEEKDFRFIDMPYDSIKTFKIGSRRDHKFPKQKNVSAYKPLLKAVFIAIEKKLKGYKEISFKYYLEIKSIPSEYGISQPQPKEFVNLVMQVVTQYGLEQRVIIKSFDTEILSEMRKNYPQIKVSYLLYKTPIKEGLRQLNFKPDVLSPHFTQLKNIEQVKDLQKQDIKIIVWTVNEKQHIRKMFKLGVDGIISDFPEKVLREKKKSSNQE